MLNLEAVKGIIDKEGVNIPDYEVVTPVTLNHLLNF